MILFLVSSGIKIGIGHVKRCTQLAIDLIKKEQEVLLCLEYDFESLEIIKKSNLDTFILPANYTMVDVLKTQPTTKVVVMDLITISKEETRKIKEYNSEIGILTLDYFDMQNPNVDTIINLHNHNKEFSRPVAASVKYLEGPMYGILRTEFDSFLEDGNKLLKKSLKKILVTFGGSDPKEHTLSILSILDKIVDGFDSKLTVVIGPNFVHKNQVLTAIEKMKSEVEAVHNPSNMAQLMKEADLCICGSGTTILELAALGTPAIVVPQSMEELGFASRFESAGFAIIAGTPESIDKIMLEKAFKNYYTHPEKLAQAGSIGKTLCDGKGKERIVEEIFILNN